MLLAGAGQIGMVMARRMGYGMKIVIRSKHTLNNKNNKICVNVKEQFYR